MRRRQPGEWRARRAAEDVDVSAPVHSKHSKRAPAPAPPVRSERLRSRTATTFVRETFLSPNIFGNVVNNLDPDSISALRLVSRTSRDLVGETLHTLRVWSVDDAGFHSKLRALFPGLKALHVGCCPIASDDEFPYCTVQIMEDLSANIWLSSPYAFPGPSGGRQALQSIPDFPSIRLLDLQLVDFQADEQFRSISRLTSLVSLSMHVPDQSVDELGAGLIHLKQLHLLNLTFEFDSTGIDSLLGLSRRSVLKKGLNLSFLTALRSLKRLSLKDDWGCSNMYFHSADPVNHATFEAALATHLENDYDSVLVQLTQLQSIDLSRLELMASKSIYAQLNVLSKLTQLTGLSIAGDILAPDSPDSDADMLLSLASLRELRHLSVEGRNPVPSLNPFLNAESRAELEQPPKEWKPLLGSLRMLTQLTALKLIGERTGFLSFDDMHVEPQPHPHTQLLPLSVCADGPVWQQGLLQAVDAMLLNQRDSLRRLVESHLGPLLLERGNSAPRTLPPAVSVLPSWLLQEINNPDAAADAASASTALLPATSPPPAAASSSSPPELQISSYLSDNMAEILNVWIGADIRHPSLQLICPRCITHMNLTLFDMSHEELHPVRLCVNLRWLYVTFHNAFAHDDDRLPAEDFPALPCGLETLIMRDDSPERAVLHPDRCRLLFANIQEMQNLALLMLNKIYLHETFLVQAESARRPILSLPNLQSLLLCSTGLLSIPIQRIIQAPELTNLVFKEPWGPPPASRRARWRFPPKTRHLSMDSCGLYCLGSLKPITLCTQLRALNLDYYCSVGHDALVKCINALPCLQLFTTAGCGCRIPGLLEPVIVNQFAPPPPDAPNNLLEDARLVLDAFAMLGAPVAEDGAPPPAGEAAAAVPRPVCSCAGHSGNVQCKSTWQHLLLDLIPHPALRMVAMSGIELSFWPPYTRAIPAAWVADDVANQTPAQLLDGAVHGMVGILQQDVNVMRSCLGLHHLEIVIT